MEGEGGGGGRRRRRRKKSNFETAELNGLIDVVGRGTESGATIFNNTQSVLRLPSRNLNTIHCLYNNSALSSWTSIGCAEMVTSS